MDQYAQVALFRSLTHNIDSQKLAGKHMNSTFNTYKDDRYFTAPIIGTPPGLDTPIDVKPTAVPNGRSFVLTPTQNRANSAV